MICPTCDIEMLPTYEPYESRCPKCGYHFDHFTGKPVDPVNHEYADDLFDQGQGGEDWISQCQEYPEQGGE